MQKQKKPMTREDWAKVDLWPGLPKIKGYKSAMELLREFSKYH